ncbi:MAG: polymorphic toxin-type HINT domain-containing protein [Phycisphaerales bacterium]
MSLAFSMEDMYGDGMNLYEYLGSNPWQRRDPMGLSWDPFDAVDDYLAETAGNRAALLSSLGQNTKAAALVAATIASYLPFPVAGNLGELALYALGESSDAQLAMGLALGVVPGGKLAHMFAKSGLGKFIGKIGASAWKSAKHYAGKAGSALGRGAGGLADRAGQFLRKGCGCFESGTVVWTIRGVVPIETVTTDDFVYAQDEATGELSLRRVVQTFVRQGAPIVAVTITTVSGAQETLRTTEEDPFWVPEAGWVEAGNLTAGDAVEVPGGCATIESIQFTPDLEAVYNFEVEGVHTYFVGASGVLVHNTDNCFDFKNIPESITRNFTNPGKIEYHWNKHAKKYGKSPEQYMEDALDFFSKNKHRGHKVSTEVGEGIKIHGQPGGIWAPDGRIVTFWYD